MRYIIGDIGNTLIKISVLNNNLKIIKSFNIETKKIYKNSLKKNFLKKLINLNSHNVILFSSVVPSIFKIISAYLNNKKYKVIEIKSLNLKKIININVDKYNQVGSDRLANAIGAYYNFKKQNCLIIDFGTATTFDIVKKNGTYDGGVIAPGIQLSIQNLNKGTALLPAIKLKSFANSYGKNTVDAINSGFLWGYQGLINNIIKKITLNGKKNYKIILTGGYAKIFKKYIIAKPIIDQNITIKGIIRIYKNIIL